MGFKRACLYDNRIEREARVGDGMMEFLRPVTVATAGALTITVPAVLGGAAIFTGAAGAVAYTTPTAADLLAAMPDMDIGDTYSFTLTNTAAQTATITAGVGVTLAGFTTVNAATRKCIMEKTSATTVTITSI